MAKWRKQWPNTKLELFQLVVYDAGSTLAQHWVITAQKTIVNYIITFIDRTLLVFDYNHANSPIDILTEWRREINS